MTMTWFRSLRRTPAPPSPSPTVSRRRFFAGAGAVAGSALLASPAWAEVQARADAFGIQPGTLVDAQGRPLDREPLPADPLLGEIMMVGFNFSPRGWAFCDGQLLAIAENTALFALLGTIYGGDGRTTFGLPDLRGRVPVHAGTGPGLTPRPLGQRAGTEAVTLTGDQVPAHEHTHPQVQVRGLGPQTVGVAPGGVQGSTTATSATGGDQAHPNMPPFLVIHFCIALTGVFPSRD